MAEPVPGGPGAVVSGERLPPLPAAVRARFWGYEEGELRDPAHRGFVIARLLEEGEGDELRWLTAAVERDGLAAWLARHGAALSHRSRAFWCTVLGVPPPPPRPLAADLWPLS
jgi:hypothetical protein